MASISEFVPGLPEQPLPVVPEGARRLGDSDQESDPFLKHGYEKAHQSYLLRRPESDDLLKQTRPGVGLDTDAWKRIHAWNGFVDTLRSSHLDLSTKVQIANVWCNEVTRYGVEDTYYQTAFQTASSGMAKCGGIARFKYETLRAIGVDDKNMRLVGGRIYDPKGDFIDAHEILLVNIKGNNFVLNDNVTGGHFNVPLPIPHGGVEPARRFMWGTEGRSAINNYGRFIPLTADSETGTMAYPTFFDKKGEYIFPPNVSGPEYSSNKLTKSRLTADGKFSIYIPASSTQ
jgi:predicted transglutaminase-like cysteine proteinase